MSIKTALYTFVSTNAAIAAAATSDDDGNAHVYLAGGVPTDDNGRVELTQYITMQRTSKVSVHHFRGGSGLANGVWRFSCYAPSSVTLETMSEAVRENVDGLRNRLMTGIEVEGTFLESEIDDIVEPSDASEAVTFVTHLDISIHYKESLTPVG